MISGGRPGGIGMGCTSNTKCFWTYGFPIYFSFVGLELISDVCRSFYTECPRRNGQIFGRVFLRTHHCHATAKQMSPSNKIGCAPSLAASKESNVSIRVAKYTVGWEQVGWVCRGPNCECTEWTDADSWYSVVPKRELTEGVISSFRANTARCEVLDGASALTGCCERGDEH